MEYKRVGAEVMEFCPKRRSRLVPKKEKTVKKASLILVCAKCGYKKRVLSNKVAPKVAKVAHPNPQKVVAVIGREEQKLRTLPTIKIECPRCGNNFVYVWQVKTRGTDESSTRFFRCTKCG